MQNDYIIYINNQVWAGIESSLLLEWHQDGVYFMKVNVSLMISLINRHYECLNNYDQGNINPLIIIKAVVKEASYTRKTGVYKKLYKGSSGVIKE